MSAQHQQHLEEIDRSLADIQVMGHVAIRAAQNLRCSEDDTEYYRLPEQETTMLLFSVHDVLDRIEKLRAKLDPAEAAAEPAKVVRLASDAPKPAAADIGAVMMAKSDIDWALHQIQQMVIIARRSTEKQKPSIDPAYLLMPSSDVESLEYSLGDILDKVVALKEGWDDADNVVVAG
jgi:hypothetical protein